MTSEERKQQFIEKAKKVHIDENLDYSEVNYVNNRTAVKIIDHDLKPDGTEYGEFWQTPSNHLKGQSHPNKRGHKISSSKLSNQREIIERFKKVHADENLDYSEVVYKGMHVKVKIIDHDLKPDGTEYGEYWQEPVVHLKGCSHPLKSIYTNALKQRTTKEEFVSLSKKIHKNNDYSYDLVEYVNNRTNVKIVCNKIGSNGKPHGVFNTIPYNFLRGKGCPKCGNQISKIEDYLFDYLSDIIGKNSVVKCDRTVLGGKELDLYIPSKKLAIEINGNKWHSEEYNKDKFYHLNKKLECDKLGITLLHIFEDEYLYSKDIVLSKIKNILKLNKNTPKIGARKCIIKEIDYKQSKDFLDKNHIQGKCKSTVYFGLFYKDSLVSVMTFTKSVNNSWILSRFASDINYIIQGAASRLLKHFQLKYKPSEIITFLDRRWEHDINDNLYIKLGFKQTETLKPNYKYTNGHGKRVHKFNFRKQKLHKKYGFPLSMTESEMTKKLGYYKIWDCGLIKYRLSF